MDQMTIAVCGGFLFIGGILAWGIGEFGHSDIFTVLGLRCTLVGLGILVSKLCCYYWKTYCVAREGEGDDKDDT